MQEKEYLKNKLKEFKDQLDLFLGHKKNISQTIMACLLTGNHFLIEDYPGLGKTTFVKLVAQLLDLKMKRIQCTSDLLPSDIIGTQFFDQKTNSFVFHEGPIFTHILLADELNRASAKTQSALLEAMEENSVTIDKETKQLPNPFFVIATQNPVELTGTFSLPESQMDRFAAKIRLNYPIEEKEKKIFIESLTNPLSGYREKILSAHELLAIQRLVDAVYLSKNLIESMYHVIKKSRQHEDITLGISTRGGVQWLRMAKAIAFQEDRDFVTPDDLTVIAKDCLMHRMIFKDKPSQSLLENILESMDI